VPACGAGLAPFPCLISGLAMSRHSCALRYDFSRYLAVAFPGQRTRRFKAGANFPGFSCSNLEQFGANPVQLAVKSKARLKDATITRNAAPVRAVEEEPALDPELDAELSRRPGVGTLARTKSLILAAVRVWELKRGLRN